MDFNSSVLLVSAFLVGWLAGGFILLGPQIIRQIKARRRQRRWLELISGDGNNAEDRRQRSIEATKRGGQPKRRY